MSTQRHQESSSDDQQELADRFCRETEGAHEALLLAIRQLQVALMTTGRTTDGRKWRTEADREIASLMACLKSRCEESDSYGGLIREMEFRQGASEYLTQLRISHETVLSAAQSIISELESLRPSPSPSHWLRALNQLSTAIHEHEAREIDVIYETFWRDPVGGD